MTQGTFLAHRVFQKNQGALRLSEAKIDY